MNGCTMPTSVPLYTSGYGLQPHTGLNGFNSGFGGFRKRCERVDWRKIASIDIDLISQTLDFSALQDNLLNITFCSIESELDMRMIDPNFIKLFKLSQLIIEYLLNSQEYLGNVILELEEKLKGVTDLNETNELQLKDKLNELSDVKKESHKRKKLLTAQQQLITTASVTNNKCPHCPKSFLTASFLQSHLDKRHADLASKSSSGSSHSLNVTLQKELAEIKERLRLTETQLHTDQGKPRSRASSPVKWTDDSAPDVMVLTSPRFTESPHKELEKMRELYMKELRDLSVRYESSQIALQELQGSSPVKKSNLGTLKDDVDMEEVMSQQKQELSMMQQNLQLQMEDMKLGMQDKLTKQERRWQRRMQATAAKHGEEIERMNAELVEKGKLLDVSKQTHAAELQYQDDQFQKIKQEQHKQAVQEKLQQQRSKPLRAAQEAPIQPKRRSPAELAYADPTNKVTEFTMDDDDDSEAELAYADPTNKVTEFTMDDDDDDSEDSDLEAALKATGLKTQSTHSSLRSTSEPEISKAKSLLRKDPKIVKGMRDEVQSLLNAKLESIGVPPESRGLGSKLLEIKLALLRNERKGKEQRFQEFKELRQKILRNVSNNAKEKTKTLKKSPASPRIKASQVVSRSAHASPVRQSPGQLESPRRPPRPAPRTTPTLTTPVRQSLQSTGSEWTSSQWDDSDSEETDSEEEDDNNNVPQRKMATASPIKDVRIPVTSTLKSSTTQPTQSQPPVPIIRTNSPTKPTNERLDDKLDESDWDDISELEAIPAPVIANRPRVPSPKGGVNVAQRSKQVQIQLANRGNSKPVGGVDTMKSTGSLSSANRSSKNLDDDDGILSDLSFSDDEPPAPTYASPLKRPTSSHGRQSYAETDNSTNTYNTSKWGSSRAPSESVNDDWPSDDSAM